MKHEIEIPDLPEGWRVVAYRIPRKDENYLGVDGLVEKCSSPIYVHRIIVEKIKPRSIKLEETEEDSIGNQEIYISGTLISIKTSKIWRVVEEE